VDEPAKNFATKQVGSAARRTRSRVRSTRCGEAEPTMRPSTVVVRDVGA
jgi:hypothetical protein